MAIAIALSNGRTWKTKAAALNHFKAMLARHADGAVIEDRSDHDDLVALLERYDEAITDGSSKTGVVSITSPALETTSTGIRHLPSGSIAPMARPPTSAMSQG